MCVCSGLIFAGHRCQECPFACVPASAECWHSTPNLHTNTRAGRIKKRPTSVTEYLCCFAFAFRFPLRTLFYFLSLFFYTAPREKSGRAIFAARGTDAEYLCWFRLICWVNGIPNQISAPHSRPRAPLFFIACWQCWHMHTWNMAFIFYTSPSAKWPLYPPKCALCVAVAGFIAHREGAPILPVWDTFILHLYILCFYNF